MIRLLVLLLIVWSPLQAMELRTFSGRPYRIEIPTGPGPFPLILVLHGAGGSAELVWSQTSLPRSGVAQGMIVVAPQAAGTRWNDGGKAAYTGNPPSSADDIGYLNGLIERLIRDDRVDAHAVFMIGISNGGFMTQRFACEAGEKLRGGGNVSSGLPLDFLAACRSSAKLPWIEIAGTADPLVPFDGRPQPVIVNGTTIRALASAEATFHFWADRAGCASPVQAEFLPDSDPGDGVRPELFSRAGCIGGAASLFYVLHGGGHVWPGMPPSYPSLGRIDRDLDAGAIIAAYFRSVLDAR